MEKKITTFLQKEIDQKHIPGAAIQVNHKGEVVFEEALGWRIDYEEEQDPMRMDTVFDLASLTKVVATLPSVLKLIDEGEIALGDPVAHFIPEFSTNDKSEITLLNLLTHTSGLTSHRKFYQEKLSKEEIFKKIYEETLEYEPGSKVVYSDLGFILLSKIVEVVTQKKFDEFVTKEIFEPFGMNETTFLPDFSNERYAATEFDVEIDSYKLGVVHDENADALVGVSGHVGVFSSISDLKKYVTMIEYEGALSVIRIIV